MRRATPRGSSTGLMKGTASTAWRISLGPIAPMQPTRKVSICVSLPG